jgi:hypothetical protein
MKAELSLTSPPKRRRTSLQVKFDARYNPEFISPDYLSIFFRIPVADIIKVEDKWKDLIMQVILDREQGTSVYNSLFIPKNNID